MPKHVNNNLIFFFSEEDGPLTNCHKPCLPTEMGLNATAKAYGVPKATLKRHLYGSNKHANGEIKKLGRQQVLPLHVEEELVKHLVAMENMFFGVTRKKTDETCI